VKLLILRNTITWLETNNVLFANEFLERGWEVCFGLVNSLATYNYHVYGDVAPYRTKLQIGDDIHASFTHENLEQFDLIWVMNLPHPRLAMDVWQMLWLLSKRRPFVNSVESMLFLNTKNTLGYLVPEEHLAENYVSNRFETIWGIYHDRRDERWMLKPTNDGCGSDVFLLEPGGSNVRALVQSATGNTEANEEMSSISIRGLHNKYTILQSFIPEVKKGEKRVILAGGEVIAWYGRLAAEDDHRSNMTQGGKCFAVELSPEEHTMCAQIARRVLDNGVGFIGLDIAYPYILEFNIVNPGGLQDTMLVTNINSAPKVVDCILKTCLH
jgi:glutathione synthase